MYIIKLETHDSDGISRRFYSPYGTPTDWTYNYKNSLLFSTEQSARDILKKIGLEIPQGTNSIAVGNLIYSIVEIPTSLDLASSEDLCWITGTYNRDCCCAMCVHKSECNGSDIEEY